MLVRFDSQIKPRGKLQRATALRSRLLFITAVAGLVLIAWLFYRYILQPSWITRLPDIVGEFLFLLEAASAVTLVVLGGLIYWQRKQDSAAAETLSLPEMQALSPGGFESYVAGLFRQKGYRVRQRGRRGDRGVDLELTHASGRKAIVQCKRYTRPIGPDIVRELFGTLVHERVHHAFLVTTAEISDAAREWANDKPMTLIDGPTLVRIAAALQRTRRS